MAVRTIKSGLDVYEVTVVKKGKVTWRAFGSFTEDDGRTIYADERAQSESAAIKHWIDVIEGERRK